MPIAIAPSEVPPMALLGIDIYNGTPLLNWAQARAQGVAFMVAKCSQGWAGGPGGWMDWVFPEHVDGARLAGVLPGGYHWGLRGNGEAQAELFVQSLSRRGGPQGFLCGLDVEETVWNPALNIDPPTVDAFVREWDLLTHQPLLMYGAGWYHNGFMHAGSQWANRPCWPAQYTGVGPGPIAQQAQSVTPGFMYPFGGWNSYAIRQFTDNAIMQGQNGGAVEVDANVTYLSWAQLYALTQPPGKPTPQGEFVMDAAATAEFKVLEQKLDGLITVIQGGIPPAKNPFGLVGTKDLLTRIEAIEAKLGIK